MSDSYRGATVAGVVVSVLLFFSFMLILTRPDQPFPTGYYDHGRFLPINPSDQIGPSMSVFLWDYRGFDLLMITLVIFSTSICCLALLRRETR